MREELDYLAINRALWNERTPYHIASAFYDQESFLKGKSSLNDIEAGLLGSVAGKSLLHLQCHFGQDSLSLARMGAQVTGVDFSEVAITKAREFNQALRLGAHFICSDIYALPENLDEQFDIVFTSYGAIGWLPDMARWAQVVARHLKPGGKVVLVEFHPVVFMLNNDLDRIEYSYFNRDPIIDTASGTYAERDAPIGGLEVGWNHPLSEVIENLIHAGLRIESFEELDYSPYGCFNNMVEVAPGRFQIRGMEGKMPLVYALAASSPPASHS